MLSVSDGVTDHVLKEHLEDTPGLFVDEATDTLDATTAGQTPDGRLGDTWRGKNGSSEQKDAFMQAVSHLKDNAQRQPEP